MPVDDAPPAAQASFAHEATLHYSEALVRRAVGAYWRRMVGMSFVAAMALLVVILAALVLQDDRSWKTGALGTLIGLGVLASAFLYVIPMRDSVRKLREMKTPEATFGAGESGFRFASEQGDSTLQWAAVTELWVFHDFWLLSLSKSQFITLPLVDLSPEMQAYVLQRVRAAGTKVR